MVRILADKHHFYLVERTEVEGVEDQFSGWIAASLSVFLTHKGCQCLKVGLIKFRLQALLPTLFYLYVHAYILYKVYIERLTFLSHGFWPDAGLNLTDMCLSQVVHTQATLSDTTTNGQWQ